MQRVEINIHGARDRCSRWNSATRTGERENRRWFSFTRKPPEREALRTQRLVGERSTVAMVFILDKQPSPLLSPHRCCLIPGFATPTIIGAQYLDETQPGCSFGTLFEENVRSSRLVSLEKVEKQFPGRTDC